MSVTRTTLLGGPAAVTFGGHIYFAHDGILVTPALELAAVDSDAQGVLDATATVAPVMIKFTPTAPFADLVALYPYTLGTPGMSLFGDTDSLLVLVASNGVRLTFSAAAIIQMPDLMLSSSGAAAGAVTFLALGARSLPITAANRLVTVDTAEPAEFSFVPPQLTDDFKITWGAMPWVNLRARDGVKIHFAMKTSPVLSAANALLDLTLDSLAVEARFTPGTPSAPAMGGLAEADVFGALQVQEALPGRLVSTGAHTLDVAGEHLWFRLPLAQLTQGPLRFDAVHSRVGELVFVAGRALLGAEALPEALVGLSEGEAEG